MRIDSPGRDAPPVADGVIEQVYEGVSPEDHPEDVLADLTDAESS